MGVNGVQMSKYVNGTSKLGFDVLLRLQRHGLSIDWLLTGSGNPEVPDASLSPDRDASGFIGFLTQDQIDQLQALLLNARPAEEIKKELERREKEGRTH